jgi:hypothetical protein
MVFPRQHVAVQVALRGYARHSDTHGLPYWPLSLSNFTFTSFPSSNNAYSALFLRPLCFQTLISFLLSSLHNHAWRPENDHAFHFKMLPGAATSMAYDAGTSCLLLLLHPHTTDR